MAHSLKSVRHLLKDKPTLKTLQLEISAQKALLGEVRHLLPGELAEHCVAARLHDQQLILHADSAVWAARLRFLGPTLVSLLQPDHPALREIKARQLPQTGAPPAHPHKARHSDLAAAIIHESARDTSHPPLRAALQRLSRALRCGNRHGT